MDTPKAWEKQATETHRAYAAFSVYRDLGTAGRSLQNAADEFYERRENGHAAESERHQMARWSSDHGWVVRVEAFDLFLDGHSIDAQIEAARTMRSEYAHLAEQMRERVKATLQRMTDNDVELTASEAVKFAEAAQKIESWARDLPSEITEQRGQIAVEVDDKRALAQSALDEVRQARDRRVA